ncbi:2-hydroxyacid dehydrogenase [Phaeovulum sp.]|uniref:2-hydroxyacid dehydrogenase n=1 Tax=Phaeovulum sp. TaxID=2934796 RepID=UPI0039E443B1
MLTVLFAAPAGLLPDYETPLADALAEFGLSATIADESTPAAQIDYVIYAPTGPVQDFTPYRNARAVLSLWAGVERIVGNPTLIQPLCRMVDPGLTEGMVEWVTGHVLRTHLGIDRHILNQDGVWRHYAIPPLARERRVTVLGLGALGAACGAALAALNFQVTGWSRSPKSLPGITCLSGNEGFSAALAQAEILVTLLPNTPDTENILDSAALAQMPQGAVILNPGRGSLIDDTALLAALDRGHIAQATLDVFRTEPLPPEHPYWAHPKVTVTPHIAADTRPGSAARVIAENIRRDQAGEPLLYLVDRQKGY